VLSWDGNALLIEIDEVTVPVPSRVCGQVRLYPDVPWRPTIPLDAEGHHRWRPLAPCARVEVALDRPALRWSGAAYFDSNVGDSALETAFTGWHWSRASLGRGTVVLYDIERRDGTALSLAMQFGRAGDFECFVPPLPVHLPRTRWRLARATRVDAGYLPIVVRTLEDGPFYARSVLAARLLGQTVTAVHESLSLDRFSAKWVQMLLPFRMPRAWP
jgi:carotenoid 1,2-hydratase